MTWPKRVREKLKTLPDAPGCYLMRDREGRIVYVGKAASLRKRVSGYFREYARRSARPKIRSLIASVADFDVVVLGSEAEAILTEGRLIKEYRPYYNTLWKDDKRFTLIRIDLQRPYPRVSRCRIRKDDGAAYFGPYVSGAASKAAAEFAERFYGLRRCRSRVPDEAAWAHCNDDVIANCSAPCVGRISPEAYRRRAEEACAFLRGERMEVLRELRGEMERAAGERRYEEAAALRDLLMHLNRAVKERARVRKTPAMKRGEARRGLEALRERLRLPTLPETIECFDVSHVSGTHCVASMVRAEAGVPTPGRYRRFRIKTVEGIDDPRAIGEAVRRRYARLLKEARPLPDLVLVDGGITQLRAAKAELVALGLPELPVAGLAKRYEEIVWDWERNAGNLVLPERSPALDVVTRLRDEAHRFAISYNRELRRKRMRDSLLDEIAGIGPAKKQALLARFGSVARLARAAPSAIAETPGIGPKVARVIVEELRGARGEEDGDAGA